MPLVINTSDLISQDRSEIIEMFDDLGIQHGEMFDDGRRWCGVCEHPRIAVHPVHAKTWTDKACKCCNAVWPEHIEEFMTGIIEENEELESMIPATIN
jgi:hypothetical protein